MLQLVLSFLRGVKKMRFRITNTKRERDRGMDYPPWWQMSQCRWLSKTKDIEKNRKAANGEAECLLVLCFEPDSEIRLWLEKDINKQKRRNIVMQCGLNTFFWIVPSPIESNGPKKVFLTSRARGIKSSVAFSPVRPIFSALTPSLLFVCFVFPLFHLCCMFVLDMKKRKKKTCVPVHAAPRPKMEVNTPTVKRWTLAHNTHNTRTHTRSWAPHRTNPTAGKKKVPLTPPSHLCYRCLFGPFFIWLCLICGMDNNSADLHFALAIIGPKCWEGKTTKRTKSGAWDSPAISSAPQVHTPPWVWGVGTDAKTTTTKCSRNFSLALLIGQLVTWGKTRRTRIASLTMSPFNIHHPFSHFSVSSLICTRKKKTAMCTRQTSQGKVKERKKKKDHWSNFNHFAWIGVSFFHPHPLPDWIVPYFFPPLSFVLLPPLFSCSSDRWPQPTVVYFFFVPTSSFSNPSRLYAFNVWFVRWVNKQLQGYTETPKVSNLGGSESQSKRSGEGGEAEWKRVGGGLYKAGKGANATAEPQRRKKKLTLLWLRGKILTLPCQQKEQGQNRQSRDITTTNKQWEDRTENKWANHSKVSPFDWKGWVDHGPSSPLLLLFAVFGFNWTIGWMLFAIASSFLYLCNQQQREAE